MFFSLAATSNDRYFSSEYGQSGADPRFSFRGGGGGGAKGYVPARTLYERGTELTFGRGSLQGPLKGPGRSGVVLMVSCAI